MTYQEAVATLAQLGPELNPGTASTNEPRQPPRKFSLEHIRVLLRALDDPQRRFRSILIAGTNGKGSTAATLASMTQAARIRTGLYTSPHLVAVTERIRVDGAEIGVDAFGRCFGRVYGRAGELVLEETLPHVPSFFELLTATAFLYFAEQGIALAVLEVGLGGRLDATNVVDPLVSVITDIGMDHMEFLGETLGEIATEKAGILRQDGILVTLSQHPEANAAIGNRAVALGVRGVDAARCLPPRGFVGEAASALPPAVQQGDAPRPSPLGRNRYPLVIDGAVLEIDSPLAGQHQQRNLALAVATALELRANHGFSIPDAAIEAGVRSTVWPGRLEWITSPEGQAPLLLDVAHNPAGAWTLRAALAQLPEAQPRTLLFSCLADKQVHEMARILMPLFDPTSGDPARRRDHIVLAPVASPRAATVRQLTEAARVLDIPVHAAPHVPAALQQAWAVTPPNGVVVVTGSVYLVGEVRTLVLQRAHSAG